MVSACLLLQFSLSSYHECLASHMDQLTTGQRRDLKVSVDKLLSDTPVEKLRLFAAVSIPLVSQTHFLCIT